MYRITQTTEYSYSRLANHSINQLRLFPLSDATQNCLSFDLDVNVAFQRHDYQDYWDNRVTMLYIHEPHTQLVIRTTADVDVASVSPFADAVMDAPSSTVLDATRLSGEYRRLYAEYLAPSPYTTLGQTDSLEAEAQLWQNNPDILSYAGELSQVLFNNFAYSQGSTTVTTTAEEFLQHRQGVCQDFAHLMLSLCRRRGIAARYVSGYLYCGEDSALRGDAAMHAWVDVHVPGVGWMGFDPTNNVRASSQHIRVAVGRDYADITPVKGVVSGGGEQQSGGAVSVQYLLHQSSPPRV